MNKIKFSTKSISIAVSCAFIAGTIAFSGFAFAPRTKTGRSVSRQAQRATQASATQKGQKQAFAKNNSISKSCSQGLQEFCDYYYTQNDCANGGGEYEKFASCFEGVCFNELSTGVSCSSGDPNCSVQQNAARSEGTLGQSLLDYAQSFSEPAKAAFFNQNCNTGNNDFFDQVLNSCKQFETARSTRANNTSRNIGNNFCEATNTLNQRNGLRNPQRTSAQQCFQGNESFSNCR